MDLIHFTREAVKMGLKERGGRREEEGGRRKEGGKTERGEGERREAEVA